MNNNPNRGNHRKEKPMNLWTKGMCSAVLAAFGVAIGAQAVEPAVGDTIVGMSPVSLMVYPARSACR